MLTFVLGGLRSCFVESMVVTDRGRPPPPPNPTALEARVCTYGFRLTVVRLGLLFGNRNDML